MTSASWRCRLNDRVELEFEIEKQGDEGPASSKPSNSSQPDIQFEEGKDGNESILLDIQNFSGKIRIRQRHKNATNNVLKPSSSSPRQESTDFANKSEKPGSSGRTVSFHPSAASSMTSEGGSGSIFNSSSKRETAVSSVTSEGGSGSLFNASSKRETTAASSMTSESVFNANSKRESGGIGPVSNTTSKRESSTPFTTLAAATPTTLWRISSGGKGPPKLRPPLPFFLSTRTIDQMSIVDDSGENELHRLCGGSSLNYSKVHAMLDMQPELAKQVDKCGRLPIHTLGSNGDLLVNLEGQTAARQTAYLLMEVHPNGLIQTDKDDNVPFTKLIKMWLEWTAEQYAKNNNSNRSKGGNDRSTTMSERGGSSSYLKFPPVMMFDEVKWCFDMLSVAIEHLGGMPLSESQHARPLLAYSKQRDDRAKLVENLSSAPELLKSILLLESKEMSKDVMELPYLKRLLFCPEAYGPWLIQMMIRKKEPASEIAVDFLSTISKLDVQDFVGSSRKSYPQDETLFHDAKLAVYDTLENFEGIIPAFLIMKREMGDRALATPVATFVLNRRVAQPFSVSLATADLKMNVAIIMTFRHAILFPEDFPVVILPFVTPRAVLIAVFISQILRRLTETVLLARVSKKLARNHILGGWVLLDTISIVMAMWAVSIQESGHIQGESHVHIEWPLLYAFILGLLWLKMLGFMRLINEHLATFVSAVSVMLFNLRYFFLVFWIFIWMMGDMFRVVFMNNEDIECEGDDIGELEEDFCNNSLDPYLRVYSVVVGDFEYSDYSQHPSVKTLWLILTLFGTVILLNVLIAIVSFVYSSCQESSIILFRRARAEYIASHTALEGLVMPTAGQRVKSFRGKLITSYAIILGLTFLCALVLCTLYFFSRLATAISTRSYFDILVFIIICLLAVYSGITAFLISSVKFVHKYAPDSRIQSRTQRILQNVNERIVIFTGVDKDDTEIGEVVPAFNVEEQRHEELMHRLVALEKTLEEMRSENVSSDETDGIDVDDKNDGSLIRKPDSGDSLIVKPS